MPPIAVLPLPTEDDSLSVLMAKLSLCLYVLHIHALVVDAISRMSNNEMAESRAMNGMRPLEREYFIVRKEWISRRSLELTRTLTDDIRRYLKDR